MSFKKELQSLSKGNRKDVPKKRLKQAYEEIKEDNKFWRKEFRKARSKGDFGQMARITEKIDSNLEKQLKAELEDKIVFKFRNTEIQVKEDYINKLKDPDKYVNKLYFNKTLRQAKKAIKEGKSKQASGLLELAYKSQKTLQTDLKKERQVSKEISRLNRKLKNEDRINKKQIDKDYNADEATSVDVIYTGSGQIIEALIL